MNMKALLGAVLALVLAVGGAAFLVANFATPAPPPPTPAVVAAEKAHKDELESNPFDLAAPGPKPKAVVEKTHFEFGVMRLGAEQSHDYVFKNEGEGPLMLAKGPMMCKCTIPVVPDQQIMPGESISITLTWKPVVPDSAFSKEAVIWTNDPTKPKINISVKGQVYDDPVAYPGEFGLGDIPWNKDHETEVYLVSSTSKELQAAEITVSDPGSMSVTTEPVDLEGLLKRDRVSPLPQSGVLLKLKISPDQSVGPFSGWVKVKSNIKEDLTTINVSGVRTGPIGIHGPDYQAVLSMVNMGNVKSAEGKSVKLFMFLEPFGQDLEITEVVCASKHLTATLLKDPKSLGAKKERYFLSIQAIKGITPGTVLTNDNPDQLTLKINHPHVPELKFNVRYVVN